MTDAQKPPPSRWQRVRGSRAFRVAREVVIVLAIVGVVGAWQTRGHLQGDAPAFTLPTLAGGVASSTSLLGKPTMLTFWAPWCGVCKAESSNVSWAMKLAGARANVLSVASAFRDVRDVQSYVAAQGVDYPVALDQGDIAEAFQVQAYPTTYFLDAQGRITHSVVGYTTTLGMLARLWW